MIGESKRDIRTSVRAAVIFGDLSEDEIETLMVEGQYRIYGRGESIVWPGEGERWAHLVARGTIRLQRMSDGDKLAALMEFRSGDFLERAIPRFHLDAGTHGAAVCRISRRQLDLARTANAALDLRLKCARDELIVDLAEIAFELMVCDVETRVEGHLRRRYKRTGARLRLSRDELAEFVGASRQAVSQALGRLAVRGVVQIDPRHPSRIDVLRAVNMEPRAT